MIPVANSAQLVSALLSPKTNYAARSAQRQEAVQLQGVLTAQEQQKALESQQAQAETENFLQAAKSLSFMGRDRQKLSDYMRGEEKSLYERLKNGYGGDLRKWQAAEGSQWMQGVTQRLQSSPFYQSASQNRLNVMSAQAARQKGEYLIGSQQGDTYQTGEQQLADFLAGKSDSYDHRGSFKPEDAVKGLREQYAPGRYSFERVQATPDEVYNHLVSTHGAEVGGDYFHRTYKNVPVFYKTAPLEDAVKFGNDQTRLNIALDDNRMSHTRLGMQAQLQGAQLEGVRLSNQKKRNELSGKGADGMPYDHYLLSSPSEMVPLRHDPANPKQLATGVDLGKVKSLAGVTLYGNGDDILARQLGLQRTRDGYRGHFNEAFTTENGVNAINLKGVSYNILGVDSKAFYNPGDLSPGADRRSPLHGYARVTLQFSPYEAEKAGLYDPNRLPFVDKDKPTSFADSETRTGAGVYNPATGTATLYVPAGDLRNPNFLKAMQRDEKGTKSANEDFTAPYMDTGF